MIKRSYFQVVIHVTFLLVFAILGFFTQAFSQIKPTQNYHKLVKKTERKLNKSLIANKRLKYNIQLSKETPLGYWIQDYVATMDPKTGKPSPDELLPVMQSLQSKTVENRAQPGATKTKWEGRGPNNVGGRTRCIAFDPTDASGKKVWAGAVTGGLWYNNDITSASSQWQSVSEIWANITVTCVAFDPNSPGTIFVGTGEGWGTTTSTSRGYGIFKSTDSGRTFQSLSSTTGYYYINDIIVRNENGSSVVYAAVDVMYFQGTWQGGATTPGIFRSTNGGTSFTNLNIRPTGQSFNYAPADFEIDAQNRLWVATKQNAATGSSDKGGGRILYTDNGTTYTEAYKYSNLSSRMEMACAGNTANVIYAMIEKSGKADTLIKSLDRGKTWQAMKKPVEADNSIPATDFSRGQAWYDWTMTVNPKDSNSIICGAIDLFLSTNQGGSWTQISKWSNNPGLSALNCSYVHADIHAAVFNPDGKRLLIGCDGGVFYCADATSNIGNSSTAFTEKNNGYLATQFYWGDISQTKGSNFMLAGAQDNGTHAFSVTGLNNENMISGGDGGYCFISSANDNKQVVSYVYNQFYATTNNWSSSNKIIDDATTGKFINPAVLDPINDLLFTGKSSGNLYRNKLGNASTAVTTISYGASSLGAASAFWTSKSATGKTQLYVGTDAGKVMVTTDASVTSPSFTDITGTINAGYISSIYRHKLTDSLFVTVSNYGVNNVYFSADGGLNWVAKDGNLPNLPVWGIIVNPNKLGEALIATELGIFGTSNIFAASVVWQAYNVGMGPVKTLALRYRDADRMIMAITHGRGVFTSDAWSKESPIAKFGASKLNVCATETVNLLDSSLNLPTDWTWTITPSAGVVYKNGTTNKSKNPKVQFTKGGVYEVSLDAGNALGNDILTKTGMITVTDSIILNGKLVRKNQLCAADTFGYQLALNDTAIHQNSLQYEWYVNTKLMGSRTSDTLTNLPSLLGDKYMLKITSSQYCVSPNTIYLKDTILSVTGVKSLVVTRFMDSLQAANVGSGTYTWYLNGGIIGTGRIYKAKANGIYKCIYTENGCNSDSSNTLNFNALMDLKLSVNQSNIQVYPNPSSHILNFVNLSKGMRLVITESSTGRLIKYLDFKDFSGLQSNSLELISCNVSELGLSKSTYEFSFVNADGLVVKTQSVIIK